MRSYQEHLDGITAKEHAIRAELEKTIEAAANEAFNKGERTFSVSIPRNTPQEIVYAVVEHYKAAPFNWPAQARFDQMDGNSIYFGKKLS